MKNCHFCQSDSGGWQIRFQEACRGCRPTAARETLARPWRRLFAGNGGSRQGRYLETGDKSGLLTLASYKATQIITARDFVAPFA
jgi:hypothetical protein